MGTIVDTSKEITSTSLFKTFLCIPQATPVTQATGFSMARPFDPSFTHSDRERWVCIYPLYINSRRSVAQGRKIAQDKAVENPTYAELRDVCAAAGLTVGVENKVYPREPDSRDARFRGRIRVQLRDDDGTPLHEQFPNRQAILKYLGEMIPKLKSRQQSSSSKDSAASQQTTAGGGKQKKNKKKNK